MAHWPAGSAWRPASCGSGGRSCGRAPGTLRNPNSGASKPPAARCNGRAHAPARRPHGHSAGGDDRPGERRVDRTATAWCRGPVRPAGRGGKCARRRRRRLGRTTAPLRRRPACRPRPLRAAYRLAQSREGRPRRRSVGRDCARRMAQPRWDRAQRPRRARMLPGRLPAAAAPGIPATFGAAGRHEARHGPVRLVARRRARRARGADRQLGSSPWQASTAAGAAQSRS